MRTNPLSFALAIGAAAIFANDQPAFAPRRTDQVRRGALGNRRRRRSRRQRAQRAAARREDHQCQGRLQGPTDPHHHRRRHVQSRHRRHEGQRPDLQSEGHHRIRRFAARAGGRDRRHHGQRQNPAADLYRASVRRSSSSASACSTCCRRTSSMRARLYEYARSIGAKKVGVLHDTGYGNVVMREINNVAGRLQGHPGPRPGEIRDGRDRRHRAGRQASGHAIPTPSS